MGFLDDAIREHLDLKRRRGADPTEIEQAEREALGPVRRGSFEPTADKPEAAAPAYDQAAETDYEEYEAAANGQDWGDAFEDEAPIAAQQHADAPPPVSEEPDWDLASDEEPGPAPVSEPPGPVESHAEPVPPPPHADSVPPPPEVPETAEYDVEEAFAEEEGEARAPEPSAQREPHSEDEDVLEETPEFLQDAPEHDRLWFEQRPPRDFDFDG
jgi:hypothetical protein